MADTYKLNPFTKKLDNTGSGAVAANGMPTGGSAGQYLSKIDATDYNVTWSTASATDSTKVLKAGDTMSGTLNTFSLIPVTTATYGLGDGTHYWANAYIARLYVNANAYLDGATLGTAQMNGELEILNGSSTGFRVLDSRASSSTGGAGIIGRLTTDPTATGHRLGFYLLGANGQNTSGMMAYSTEAWSGTARGTKLTFATTAATTTARTERYQMDETGVLPIASATYALGGASNYWATAYVNRLYLNSTAYLDGAVAGTVALSGTLTANATSIITDTTTGLKIGTATTQKLGFFNATPVVQQTGNALTALSTLGIVSTPTLTKSDVGLSNVTNDAQLPLAGGTMTGDINGNGHSLYGFHMSGFQVTVATDNDYANMDRTGATNSQPALQTIVNALGALYVSDGKPRAIYCPQGVYSMQDNGTVWKSGVSLIGDGPGMTRFLLSNPINTTNPTPLAAYTSAFHGASTSAPLTDCTFADFEVDGSGVSLAAYSTGAKALVLQFMVRARFQNLYLHDCGATALGCDFLQDSIIDGVVALNNGRLNDGTQPGGAGIGIGIGAWGASERTTIANCTTKGNGTHGIFVELQNSSYLQPIGLRIENCHSEGNTYGISDWGADGLIVQGNTIINNLKSGFNVSASGVATVAGVGGQLLNNVIDGNGVDGVLIGDTTGRYTVNGGRVSNNGRHGINLTNTVNSQATGVATLSVNDVDIFNNGYAGINTDATLNNPFINGNRVRNNGRQSAGATSNSGGTVTYTALTVVDTAQTWTTDTQVGKTVTVGALTAIVESNTATTLTLNPWHANGSTAWTTGVTPSAGAAYSFPTGPTDTAGIRINGTTNHPVIRANRFFDDYSPRIQKYGMTISASGTCSSGQVTDNDLLGNLTASYLFTTAPSGGTWINNAGLAAATVLTPTTSVVDTTITVAGDISSTGLQSNSLSPVLDVSIPAGYGAIVGRKYKVASGKKITVGSGGRLRIL